MKVSNDFKHLKEESALLVVTGTKTAHLHVLKNGQINEQDSILIETPKYSDSEGFFIKQGSNKNIAGSGAPYDNQKDYLATFFLKTLRDHVKDALQKFNLNKIYLFGPQFFIAQEEHIFPNDIRKKIVSEFSGNFAYQGLDQLLRKIENKYKAEDDAANPATGEAGRILSNTAAI